MGGGWRVALLTDGELHADRQESSVVFVRARQMSNCKRVHACVCVHASVYEWMGRVCAYVFMGPHVYETPNMCTCKAACVRCTCMKTLIPVSLTLYYPLSSAFSGRETSPFH